MPVFPPSTSPQAASCAAAAGLIGLAQRLAWQLACQLAQRLRLGWPGVFNVCLLATLIGFTSVARSQPGAAPAARPAVGASTDTLERGAPGGDDAIWPRRAPSLVLHLSQAGFRANLDLRAKTGRDDAIETPVSLPDTWTARGLPAEGQGTYRLQFVLPEQPSDMWALRLDWLAPAHEIRLNGELLSGQLNGDDALPVAVSRGRPAWVAVPPQLLLRGHNELLIHVHHTGRGGLSAVWLGPERALRDSSPPAGPWGDALPLLLNGAGVGLSAFMLLAWRRQLDVHGRGFAALWLLLSLLMVTRASRDAVTPSALTDALVYAGEIGSIVLALIGVLMLVPLHAAARHWRAGVLAVGVPLTLAVLPAAALGEIDSLRSVASVSYT
ncbi:MAG: hypothetical protein AB9M60_13250, partial [Leptothrix sp. (in: b-proteobacteria)]